jgi:hypothetical protein
MRAIPVLMFSALLCACSASKPKQAEQAPGPMHKLFPTQNVPASNDSVPAERTGPQAKLAPHAAPPDQAAAPITDTLPTVSTRPDGKAFPPDALAPLTDTPPAPSAIPDKKLDALAEMSDATPGAATAAVSCQLYDCATVLSISKHHGTEDFQPGQGNGPGIYFATDIPEGDAVGQPQDRGEVFEEESILWEITVRMEDGTVQTMQQDYAPGVQVGDTVLVDGNTVTPWN